LQDSQKFESIRKRKTKLGNNVRERVGKAAVGRIPVSVPKLFQICVSAARRVLLLTFRFCCIYFGELSLIRCAETHACHFICFWALLGTRFAFVFLYPLFRGFSEVHGISKL